VTHYEKAPITEALIDIRVQGPEERIEELVELQKGELEKYPDKKPVYFASIELQPKELGEAPTFTKQSSTQRGWAFVAADKLQIWQVQRDGFTFSRLAPYGSWALFKDEARRLWTKTRAALKPAAVTRVAVRYINRLELPIPLKDFKDYLRTVPEVSPALPQGLSTFFMQLQIPQDDIRALLILNQSLVPPIQPEREQKSVSVLLDIDLFRAQELPQEEEAIWNYFEDLHAKKNEVFEGCITDLTRELFK
jgi:uncharacterized protein (TIGR04255 family)